MLIVKCRLGSLSPTAEATQEGTARQSFSNFPNFKRKANAAKRQSGPGYVEYECQR